METLETTNMLTDAMRGNADKPLDRTSKFQRTLGSSVPPGCPSKTLSSACLPSLKRCLERSFNLAWAERRLVLVHILVVVVVIVHKDGFNDNSESFILSNMIILIAGEYVHTCWKYKWKANRRAIATRGCANSLTDRSNLMGIHSSSMSLWSETFSSTRIVIGEGK